MLSRIVLSVVVAVIVTLGCYLVGGILADIPVQIASTIGNWLKNYGAVFGILAGLVWFFSGRITLNR